MVSHQNYYMTFFKKYKLILKSFFLIGISLSHLLLVRRIIKTEILGNYLYLLDFSNEKL